MNDLRQAAQAALEALEDLLDCPYDIDQATVPKAGIDAAPQQIVGTMCVSLARMRALRVAVKTFRDALAEPHSCVWAQADSDTDLWETSCGRSFSLNEGTPAENHMTWCCYCGKTLEEHPWVDEEDAA